MTIFEALAEQAGTLAGNVTLIELWVYMVGATITGITTTVALMWLGRWLFEYISWRLPW